MAARVTEIFGKISRTMYFTFKAMYFFHLFIHLFSSVVLRSKPYVTKKNDR